MQTTHLSSKGQIVIPQSIRAAHKWLPGLEFTITDTPEGVLLTPATSFKSTNIKSVLGCVGYKGSKKSLQDMEEGIARGAAGDK